MKISTGLKLFVAWILVSSAVVGSVHAVPVYPKAIKARQADGSTITVRLYGDEKFSYATTIDGYTLVSKNGIYYYAKTVGSQLVSTGIQAKDAARRTVQDRQALQTVAQGYPVSAAFAAGIQGAQSNLAYGASPRSEDELYGSAKSAISSGEQFKSLVILVNFSDFNFAIGDPKGSFDRMLNQEGYSENGATGSARDYYVSNSNGKFNPHFDVVGPFTLSRSAFGYNDRMEQFIEEVCDLAQSNGVDFSQYVENGILRDVFIFYAGYNHAEAGGNFIHPARIFYPDPSYDFGTWGGGRLKAAAYTSELKGSGGTDMAGIGTFCHEFGHIVGWPDFYDTDYAENGSGFNLDVFSLMATGPYVNEGRTPPAVSAYERYMANWAVLTEITEEGEYTLEPVYGDNGYMIKTANDNEFFIFEYRNGALSTWDRYLQIGDENTSVVGSGSGMMVYHVDRSRNKVAGYFRAQDTWDRNTVNAYAEHECYKLVMASKIQRVNGKLHNIGKAFFPGSSNVTEFSSSNYPYFVGWDGFTTGMELFNIKENGTSNVTFEVKKVANGTINNFEVKPLQYDITVSFSSPFNDTYRIRYQEEGGESIEIKTLDKTINLTGLKPGTKYTVSIFYGDEQEPLETKEVTTLALDPSKVASLGLKMSYTSNQFIVLNYRNIKSDITSVKWTIDGKEVTGTVVKLAPSSSGYKVMAEITTADGVEYLVKYINVTN